MDALNKFAFEGAVPPAYKDEEFRPLPPGTAGVDAQIVRCQEHLFKIAACLQPSPKTSSVASKISKALIQLKSELKAVLDQCSCEEQRRRAVTLKMVQKELSSVLEVNNSADPYSNSNTSRLVFSSNVANHR